MSILNVEERGYMMELVISGMKGTEHIAHMDFLSELGRFLRVWADGRDTS